MSSRVRQGELPGRSHTNGRRREEKIEEFKEERRALQTEVLEKMGK